MIEGVETEFRFLFENLASVKNKTCTDLLPILIALSSIRSYTKSLCRDPILFDILCEIKSLQTTDFEHMLEMLKMEDKVMCHTVTKSLASFVPLFNLCLNLLESDSIIGNEKKNNAKNYIYSLINYVSTYLFNQILTDSQRNIQNINYIILYNNVLKEFKALQHNNIIEANIMMLYGFYTQLTPQFYSIVTSYIHSDNNIILLELFHFIKLFYSVYFESYIPTEEIDTNSTKENDKSSSSSDSESKLNIEPILVNHNTNHSTEHQLNSPQGAQMIVETHPNLVNIQSDSSSNQGNIEENTDSLNSYQRQYNRLSIVLSANAIFDLIYNTIYTNDTLNKSQNRYYNLNYGIYVFKIIAVLLSQPTFTPSLLSVTRILMSNINDLRTATAFNPFYNIFYIYFYSAFTKYIDKLLRYNVEQMSEELTQSVSTFLDAVLSYFVSIQESKSSAAYTYMIRLLTENDDVLFSFLYDILNIYKYITTNTISSSAYVKTLIKLISTYLDPYSFFEQFLVYINNDVGLLLDYLLSNLSFLQFIILFLFLLHKDVSYKEPHLSQNKMKLFYGVLNELYLKLEQNSIKQFFPYNIDPLIKKLQTTCELLMLKIQL